MIGSSLLLEMMLWLSVSVILKNKAAFDTQKGANFGIIAPECVWRPGSARTRWGNLSAPPDPLAATGGREPASKGGAKGKNGKRE